MFALVCAQCYFSWKKTLKIRDLCKFCENCTNMHVQSKLKVELRIFGEGKGGGAILEFNQI